MPGPKDGGGGGDGITVVACCQQQWVLCAGPGACVTLTTGEEAEATDIYSPAVLEIRYHRAGSR